MITACLAFAGIATALYPAYLQLAGNFHTVIKGELYRSAQPSPRLLETYVRENGIKSIINLRASGDKGTWYSAEVATSQQLGVTHVDFPMSASKVMSSERADELVKLMASLPKPILIHCQAGADRSGLAAALYSNRIAGRDEETSEGQLSFYFGHVSIPGLSAAYAMDESWENFEQHSPTAG
ncbi:MULTISPECIES: tyrosine-protein phosphatase [unclassified Rhizobium]|uniref:tyrosine-protein phosphatase n=1 Tax=unclassified Rhizobium TaxID=2613769 RepID=UPI00104A67B1|nr:MULTISPECIES: tyrosine-protein phosphatase [unclassified Rhizobium]MBB3397382.1 protein tyrosine/serine phosphatase [Rhizobium sp. BK060]MBB4171584.1 protein tyrosine/serine phosphatase [Rhizobium sp. BK538]